MNDRLPNEEFNEIYLVKFQDISMTLFIFNIIAFH